MTDLAAPPTIRRPDLSAARLRRRYAAERRFRLYGLAAIVIALLMLCVLVGEIVRTGATAFMLTEIGLDVTLDAGAIDPGGTRDAATIAGASYRAIYTAALVDKFPGATRRQRGDLRGLLTRDAPLIVRDRVLDDPSLIGTTARVWITASDDIDILNKLDQIERTAFEAPGTATPLGTAGEVRILVASNAFAPVLADVKRLLRARAADRERELIAERRGLDARRARLERLRADGAAADEIARAQNDVAALAARTAALRAEIDAINARADDPGGAEEVDASMPGYFVAINDGVVKVTRVGNAEITGRAVIALDGDAEAAAGSWSIEKVTPRESDRKVSDDQLVWFDRLERDGQVRTVFNSTFFNRADSREPERAGIRGAIVGSALTLIVTLALSFPIGVMAAVYLEEFAPKNRVTDLIEVNINNLAAVPSIVFGLLGLAVLLNFFGLPRSAPLVGGMVLALMTLPTIIIAARAALKAVPPSIREAALGMGASPLQTVMHHVLPLAMPGILTGTIIGMAQALGETAPLLMIGMVAFIVDVPGGLTDPATVLPVQIFLWADAPERAFVEKTSAAIMVLLAFLIVMNLAAVLLRKRFERRW